MTNKIGVLVAQGLDVPNVFKDVPNFVKYVLYFVMDVPNFLKDVPRFQKFILSWGTFSNHFLRAFKGRNGL